MHTNMFKVMSTLELFLELEESCPGLVVMEDGNMFLSDRTISTEPLKFDETRHYINFRLYGTSFEIFMTGDYHQQSNGHLFMDYDFKLSDKTCADLYKHDITIQYNCPMTQTIVKYDRIAIEREFAIKNIING